MTKQKFYVVWKGKNTGIFDNWSACKIQIHGYEGAQYKSFATKIEAEEAYTASPQQYIYQRNSKITTSNAKKPKKSIGYIVESLAVDAACDDKGVMEYQGVWVQTRTLAFKQGPFKEGSNNIGEFLAIVHALAFLQNYNLIDGVSVPIYTDSVTALSWLRKKKHNSKISTIHPILQDLLTRAENWLAKNSYQNAVLKWETGLWGEIPADFGRK
jgi:ribonuclease HI